MGQSAGCRPLVPVCLYLMLAVSTSFADEGQDFRRHYQQALTFYERGQYQESIQEFQAAYAIKQLPKLVLNMGQANRKLGHAKEALGYYELYLRLEPDPDPKLKAELDRYIQQTRLMLAAAERIRAESQAASRQAAQERAQDQPLGRTEPPAADVNTAPARGDATAAVTPPRRSEPVVADPSADAPARAASPPAPESLTASAPQPYRPVYKRPWFWGVIGGAGAAITAGIVTGAVLGTRGPGIPDNIQIQAWSLRSER